MDEPDTPFSHSSGPSGVSTHYCTWSFHNLDVIVQGRLLYKTFLTIFPGQYLYWYGFSFVWVLMWAFRPDCCEKHFWQISHWYGFSLVWVLMWAFRFDRCEKHFWQYSHWYGFSFVWILMWRFRRLWHVKVFWQNLHWYGFSLVWVLIWSFRLDFCE